MSYLRGRTSFFDDQVARAVAVGAGQVVIIGAGYDDRAFRFRSPGVRFIEVDHPATQDDKRRRLVALGVATDEITFVPVDLDHRDLARELHPLLDPATPTTVIAEAVIPYLAPASAHSLVRDVHDCPGSSVRFALDLPEVPTDLPGRIALAVVRIGTTVVGERVRTTFTPDEAARFLSGWDVTERVTGRDLGVSAATAHTVYVSAIAA